MREGVHAVTDVTGYGLAGHAWEMAERIGVRARRRHLLARVLPGRPGGSPTRAIRTGGDQRNRDYLAGHLDSQATAGGEALCFDPQTSGGLLVAVDPSMADELHAADGWWRVGELTEGEPVLVLR